MAAGEDGGGAGAAGEERRVRLPISYRYRLRRPPAGRGPRLLCALHGYGQDAEAMLPLALSIAPAWPVAALQAPHPHHRPLPGGGRGTGYGWIADRAPEEDLANHHAFLTEVIRRAHADGLTGAPRAVLFGFSQAVSLGYRYAAARPDLVAGVIAVAGAAPSDWTAGGTAPRLPMPVLHAAPTDDEAYPLARARRFRAVLEPRCDDLTWLEPAGGHRVPRDLLPELRAWLERLP